MAATSELRLPAAHEYVVVVKRAVAAFASIAGFDVEATYDLTIATAQAFENAVTITERHLGRGVGQVKLLFTLEDQALEVQIRSACGRADLAAAQIRHVAEPRIPEPAPEEVRAATDLALRLMGLFVDDYGYQVNERTGGLRVRLTKYRIP